MDVIIRTSFDIHTGIDNNRNVWMLMCICNSQMTAGGYVKCEVKLKSFVIVFF